MFLLQSLKSHLQRRHQDYVQCVLQLQPQSLQQHCALIVVQAHLQEEFQLLARLLAQELVH